MNRVNLLKWRRKKRSKRTTLTLVVGVLLVSVFVISTHFGMSYFQRETSQLSSLNNSYIGLSAELAQRSVEQEILLQLLDQAARDHALVENVQTELARYGFFFNGSLKSFRNTHGSRGLGSSLPNGSSPEKLQG